MILLPGDSPVRGWLERLDVVFVEDSNDARIVVYDPRAEVVVKADAPGLAVLPLDENDSFPVHPQVDRFTTVKADAYAGDERGLAEALAYLREPRLSSDEGPLRLTYLGGLGAAWATCPLGYGAELGEERCTIGRSPRCGLVLRQGAHSDQNIMARLHAIVELHDGEVVVRDADSTNGTWYQGQRIEDAITIVPGAELAIAGCLRVRLDGASAPR